VAPVGTIWQFISRLLLNFGHDHVALLTILTDSRSRTLATDRADLNDDDEEEDAAVEAREGIRGVEYFVEYRDRVVFAGTRA
jgi:hypothetical protein